MWNETWDVNETELWISDGKKWDSTISELYPVLKRNAHESHVADWIVTHGLATVWNGLRQCYQQSLNEPPVNGNQTTERSVGWHTKILLWPRFEWKFNLDGLMSDADVGRWCRALMSGDDVGRWINRDGSYQPVFWFAPVCKMRFVRCDQHQSIWLEIPRDVLCTGLVYIDLVICRKYEQSSLALAPKQTIKSWSHAKCRCSLSISVTCRRESLMGHRQC